MESSKKPIYNVKGMAESARYTEYKDILSAASEIVDNSIEALADDIYVIITSKHNYDTGSKQIKDIAFFDNGVGMHPGTLHGALSYGDGTRKERKSIGRFGVGLAQASLFSAPRVEVYSWQNREEIRFSYLDTDLMKTGEQKYLFYPEVSKIPNDFYYYYNYKKSTFKSGTLVIWRDVDKSPVKRASSLINRLDPHLGQIYRYYLNNERVRITLVDDDNRANTVSVRPRDPLFLMQRDHFLADPNLLGYQGANANGETVFEPFAPKGYESNEIQLEIPYKNTKGTELTSYVNIKFSIVKEKFYSQTSKAFNNPGNSPIGKYIKKLQGISVMRAEREVDFDKFGFYDDQNNPFHRWWGVEISFEPKLDELFKISNNKQHIELKSPNQQERNEMENDGTFSLWDCLNKVISPAISQMIKLNRERQKGTRTTTISNKNSSVESSKINTSEVDSNEKKETGLGSLISNVINDISGDSKTHINSDKEFNKHGFKFTNLYSKEEKFFSISMTSSIIEFTWDFEVLKAFKLEELNEILVTGFKQAYRNIDLSMDIIKYFIEIESVINKKIKDMWEM